MFILKHHKTIRWLSYTKARAEFINRFMYHGAYEVCEVNAEPWYITKMRKQWQYAEADRLEAKIIEQELFIL